MLNKESFEISFDKEPFPLFILSKTMDKLSEDDFKLFKVNSKSLDLIVLEIDERSEEILLIFSIELLILSLLDFTMDLIIALFVEQP